MRLQTLGLMLSGAEKQQPPLCSGCERKQWAEQLEMGMNPFAAPDALRKLMNE